MELNKKAIIVLNNTNLELSLLDSTLNIGVETGCISILNQNLGLDLAISDFDHIEKNDMIVVKKKAKELIELNQEKDNLDGECAIIKAIEKGFKDITCVFEVNNRVDLNFSAISFIEKYNVKYLSSKSFMFLLNEKNEFKKTDYDKYKYISIFPLTDIIVSIKGLKYECDKLNLKKFETMGFSNSFTKTEIASISLSGSAIIIFTND